MGHFFCKNWYLYGATLKNLMALKISWRHIPTTPNLSTPLPPGIFSSRGDMDHKLIYTACVLQVSFIIFCMYFFLSDEEQRIIPLAYCCKFNKSQTVLSTPENLYFKNLN